MRSEKANQPHTADRTRPWLRVNPAHDPLEQEADRAADAFMRGAGVGAPFSLSGISVLQRCACGQANAGGECGSCRKKRLQRSATSSADPGARGADGETAPPVVHDVLGSGGRVMDGATRARMEAHFGSDFGHVRLHTDARAAESAEAVSAAAWTVGNHIAFADGQFSPASPAGQRLLAHELAHVLQQTDGLRRSPMPKDRSGRPLGVVPTPEQDAYDRDTREIEEWKKVVARLDAGELDDADLANWRLRDRLTGLRTTEIDSLTTKIKEHGKKHPKVSVARMLEYLEVRKEISTPMPEGATVSRDAIMNSVESYSLTVGNIRVTVMSDTFGNSENATGPTTNFGASYGWSTKNGVVDKLTMKAGSTDVPINPTSFGVTIRTKYNGNPNDTSAYGKGTTEDDKRNKTTTLRVHEGQHGADFIEYLRSHPFPVDLSKGVVGVLTDADMQKVQKYIAAFFKDAGARTCSVTDQVGFTQNEYLTTAEGKKSGIVSCRP